MSQFPKNPEEPPPDQILQQLASIDWENVPLSPTWSIEDEEELPEEWLLPIEQPTYEIDNIRRDIYLAWCMRTEHEPETEIPPQWLPAALAEDPWVENDIHRTIYLKWCESIGRNPEHDGFTQQEWLDFSRIHSEQRTVALKGDDPQWLLEQAEIAAEQAENYLDELAIEYRKESEKATYLIWCEHNGRDPAEDFTVDQAWSDYKDSLKLEDPNFDYGWSEYQNSLAQWAIEEANITKNSLSVSLSDLIPTEWQQEVVKLQQEPITEESELIDERLLDQNSDPEGPER